jgi:DNA repair protein RadC
MVVYEDDGSGQPKPTEKDIETTREIHDLLDHLGINLLDHVIITHQQSHSMKAHKNAPFTASNRDEHQ